MILNKDFIDNVQSGNNINAEKLFKNDMASKVGDALELKRKELANTFLKQPEEEHEV